MLHLKTPVIVAATMLGIAACCCCSFLGLGGDAAFTAGEFADAPPYTGATQTTETNAAINVVVGMLSILPGEAEWKHYTTSDSELDVLSWYQDNMPDYGWEVSTENSGDGLYFNHEDDASLMLVILTMPDLDDSGKLHILMGMLDTSP